MKSDIEIAQSTKLHPVSSIAKKLNLQQEDIENYGNYKAKISNYKDLIENYEKNNTKLVLVTAMNPTPFGEGKTTVSIGLTDGLNLIGKQTVAALREPSLGPVFGIKGGATGGGYSQIAPMEDINLHFTGDFHAITSANNLCCAVLDNHIKQGNELNIDPHSISIKRSVDMNDRQLRFIIDGLSNGSNSTANGITREDGFEITVATEAMAILCLSQSLTDLKERFAKMIVAKNFQGDNIYVKDLKCAGAMATLCKDAIKPNLVQTLEHNPVIIHGGPFANIAHGCNSVIATKTALSLSKDFVVTEAGFGADLGGEKFFDIKCRKSGLYPNAVVLVSTLRSIKHHGAGNDKDSIKQGFQNVIQHAKNIKEQFLTPVVIACNRFFEDSDEQIKIIEMLSKENGFEFTIINSFENGGKGAIDLANKVVEIATTKIEKKFVYEDNQTIEEKIIAVAKNIYHADGVIFSAFAKSQLKELEPFNYLPICIAKTQYSFSDDPKKLCAPSGFFLSVKKLKIQLGAGFVSVYTGDIMTMPGLPRVPAANSIDIFDDGTIRGLF